MRISIKRVKKGEAIVRRLSSGAFIPTVAPADGFLIQEGDGPKVYIQRKDLYRVINEASHEPSCSEDDCQWVLDQWRDDDGTQT